jgi:PmbA protein
MTERIRSLLDEAHQIARRLGVEKYDISGQMTSDLSVSAQDGAVDKISASDSTNALVRIWHPSGAVGVVVSSDISPTGLQEAFTMARDVSRQAPKDDAPIFSPEANAPLAQDETSEAASAPMASPATMVQAILSLEKRIKEAHPAIQSLPYNGITQQKIASFYAHSEGALRIQEGARCYAYAYPKAQEEGRKSRLGHATRLAASLEAIPMDELVQEAAERVIAHLDYEKIPSGRYTVVFSPHASLAILGAFSNLWNARSILDQKSLSSPESLHQMLASPWLLLSDNPKHPKNTLAPRFDGEGTPTRHTPIIQAGKLASFLHCANTAATLQQPLTGHAVVGSRVQVSSHFLHLQRDPAAQGEARKLEEAEDVIYIDKVNALHAGIQALQGSFSLPFDGWRYRRGERKSIEAATIAGDIRDLLKQIVFVSDQELVLPSGAAADIWVEGLSIAGAE